MNKILAIYFVLLLSIGNFIPLATDSSGVVAIKTTMLVGAALVISYRFKMKARRLDLLYLAFVTFAFLFAVRNSYDATYALDKYLSVSIVVLVMLAVFDRLDEKISSTETIKLVLNFGFMILLFTIMYKMVFGFWSRETRFLLNGSIVFGWITGLYAMLSLYIFNKEGGVKFLIYLLAFTLAVLWSESKGALISLIVAAIYYLIDTKKIYWKIIFFVTLGFAYTTRNGILSWAEDKLEGHRLGAIFRVLNQNTGSQDEGSISIRSDMIAESTKLFKNNWFEGIGLGNYKFMTAYGFDYPHNIHLEVFTETGLLIGSIYSIFIIYSFIKSPPILKSLILFFLIAASFSGDITYLRFLLFSCIIGLSRIHIKKQTHSA